jgi:hypothetical protein
MILSLTLNLFAQKPEQKSKINLRTHVFYCSSTRASLFLLLFLVRWFLLYTFYVLRVSYAFNEIGLLLIQKEVKKIRLTKQGSCIK